MKLSNLTKSVFALGAVALAAISTVQAGTAAASKEVVPVEAEESWWGASMNIGYDSLYIFRGVNVFGRGNNSGLVTADFTLTTTCGFTAGVWLGAADDEDYTELDAFVSYTHSFGPVDLTGGVTYYDFNSLGDETWEVFATVSTSVIPFVTPSLTAFYDWDLFEGWFIEAKVASSIPVIKDVLSIDPFVSAAYDLEYNTAGNDWNDLTVGVSIPWNVTENMTISGYAKYIWVLDALDDSQDDEWVFGGKVGLSF